MRPFKKKRDNKKKLIAIFVPASIVAVALSLGLSLGLGCKGDKFVCLPVNSTIYKINNDNVIEGFSENFLSASINQTDARNYLISNCKDANKNSKFCMDLHNQKITGALRVFSPLNSSGNEHINNILPLFTKLDFKSTQWQWNGFRTGNLSFENCDFPNVKILDLQSANFAVANDEFDSYAKDTAYNTFSNASFPSLETLNLSGAVFAKTAFNFSPEHQVGYRINTAWQTFNHVAFTSLKTLNLSGVVFSTANMTTIDDTIIITGDSTFDNSTFHSLKKINLGNCKLGNSNSGDNTIDGSCFDNLQETQWDSTDKLKLTSDGNNAYWSQTTPTAQLNTWFGLGDWTFDY